MSDRTQKPGVERAMDTTVRETYLLNDVGAAGGPAMPAAAVRLQAIHDLVRSGDYHVPAAVIADRMIEQMMAGKRRPKR